MKTNGKKPKSVPAQTQQTYPGKEHKMNPEPEYIRPDYRGSGKLNNKVAIITGGDSGIGRAVAVHFAREGAKLLIVYLEEHRDAKETQKLVEAEGVQCELISGDVGDITFCQKIVAKAIQLYKKIDVLVCNAGEQHYEKDITKISSHQIEKTFQTNIFSMFHLVKYVAPYLKEGSAIITTTSVTAYRGSDHLVDYASTKGAILAFTRSLSSNLMDKGIRVNAVAPGPIWTPFIPSSFPAKEVKEFGKEQPMKRPGQPSEVAPCYVFLACDDSSYMSGQTLHPNGGEIIGG